MFYLPNRKKNERYPGKVDFKTQILAYILMDTIQICTTYNRPNIDTIKQAKHRHQLVSTPNYTVRTMKQEIYKRIKMKVEKKRE